jgi:hypothetical protein
VQKVKTVCLKIKIKIKNKNEFNASLLHFLSYFSRVATNIQALVTACDEFLYAFFIDLRRQAISHLLDGIRHFFIAFEASAAQKFLQC